MEIVIIVLTLLIIYLIIKINKIKQKSYNSATVVNKDKEDNFNKKFIVDELDDFVLVLDQNNLIQYVNNSSEKRFGLNLINRNISTIVRDSKLLEIIEKSSKEKKTQNLKVQINEPSFLYYDIYVIPGPTHLYPDPNSIVIFIKDLTEIVKAQKFRTDFVANVSHELRTPLMSIMGSIETIENAAKDDPKAQKKFMKIISDQSNRMQTLINDLLILSRIELEEHIRPNQIINVYEIFDQIEANFELRLKDNDIKIENNLSKSITVIGDYDKLFTVFSNLVDNSIKYSKPNSVIQIFSNLGSGKLIENHHVISIKDQGIGIPREDINRVTERFYRVDVNKSRNAGGTGLGLAIMKHIITQHRGDYEILSELDKGTEIKIYLPTN